MLCRRHEAVGEPQEGRRAGGCRGPGRHALERGHGTQAWHRQETGSAARAAAQVDQAERYEAPIDRGVHTLVWVSILRNERTDAIAHTSHAATCLPHFLSDPRRRIALPPSRPLPMCRCPLGISRARGSQRQSQFGRGRKVWCLHGLRHTYRSGILPPARLYTSHPVRDGSGHGTRCTRCPRSSIRTALQAMQPCMHVQRSLTRMQYKSLLTRQRE